jgi:hypothetical protein
MQKNHRRIASGERKSGSVLQWLGAGGTSFHHYKRKAKAQVSALRIQYWIIRASSVKSMTVGRLGSIYTAYGT